MAPSRSHALDRLQTSAARGRRATLVAVVSSVFLAAVKITAGVLGNSYALVADGIESVLDVVSSAVVWGSLRIGARPPSRDFPYGFGKVEGLGALGVALILIGVAFWIAVHAVEGISEPHGSPAAFTLIVLVVVVAVKELLFRRLFSAGDSIGSRAVQSEAWHHRSDALTSAAAFIGISVALVAGEGYESADEWAALFACGIIVTNGIRLFRSALRDVLDAASPPEVTARVRDVASAIPGVRGIDECRVRRSGLSLLVDIHVVVDGALPVRVGHEIGHQVKDALLRSDLHVLDVLVHVEPEEPM